ncbi:DUF3558 family protein [Nocardia sp. Marseille-Q1738]
MGVRIGRRSSVLHLLLCLVVWLVGCSPDIDMPDYRPGFSSLPATCADAVAPAEHALKAFAGELYSPADGFEQSRIGGQYGQSLSCAVKYGDPVPREPIKSGRVPMSRSVAISYDITTLPVRAEASTTGLSAQATRASDSSRPSRLPGIGDDAITWVEEPKGGPARVGVRFRIGNLDVDVETSGKDWSGTREPFPVGYSEELRRDLQVGAESIAKAVARHAESALPTTMLTRPSSADTTTTPAPRTTASPIPVWDPCGISDRDISAAGLEVLSKRSGGESPTSGRASCTWRGAWYEVLVSSSVSFEDEVWDRDKYVRPTPLTIGGRPAVMLYWAQSDYFCDIAFDVARNTNSGVVPGLVMFEAAVNEHDRRPELCSELKRVVNTLASTLPPGT